MRYPFQGNFKLTQKFGENPTYYKQFGFNGHEGLDWGMPVGTLLYAVESGVVVRRNDDFKGNAYGLYVVIWHEELNLASWYCHMSKISVSVGDKVIRNQVIGSSGNTGNTTGPHLHFNICHTDKNGYRTNQNNGYKGFVDPMPFLKTEGGEMDNEILKRADAFVAVCEALGKPVDKDIVIADIKRLVTLEDKLRERDADLDKKRIEIEALGEKIKTLTDDKKVLENVAEKQERNLKELGDKLTQAQGEIEELKKVVPGEESLSELIFKFLKKLIGRR